MSTTERLDRFQRRFPRVGFPLAVTYKYGDDNGPYLAALLTYYAFVSIFPLMLLASTVLSIVLTGHPGLQHRLLRSALAEFPVVGSQLRAPEAPGGTSFGVVIGILGALYGALGAAQALQYAGNVMWHVPRNKRPNPFVARGRSAVLVLTAGLGLLLIVIGTGLCNSLFDSELGQLITFGVGFLTMAGVFVTAFQLATTRSIPYRSLLPGALLAAFFFQLLQNFGYLYVVRVIRRATEANALFALVLGMLAYLYVAASIVALAMEVNVVRHDRLWPRALLTPFTDDVHLTRADEASYAAQAQAQRTKGFEEIEVTFHERPR